MTDGMSTTKENHVWEEKDSIEPKRNCSNNSANGQSDIINVTGTDSTGSRCGDIGIVSGIYKIVNRVNGKYYVGSSRDILSRRLGRFDRHQRLLKRGNHFNDYLQRAWNKYGEHAFQFIIVERVSPEGLFDVEQKYLDAAQKEPNKCYNLNFCADGNNMRKICYRKNSEALKLFYKMHPERKKQSTLSCHTPSAARKRGVSLRMYFLNNPEKAKQQGQRIRDHYRSNPVKREQLSRRFRSNIEYTFENVNTKQIFRGTQFDFRTLFGLHKGSVNNLIKGRCNILKGWVILG